MNNRLNEILPVEDANTGRNPLTAGLNQGDIESNHPTTPHRGSMSSPSFMHDFFSQVETVKKYVKNIKHGCKEIQRISQDMMLATTAEAESKLSQELTPKIAAANDFVKKCKELLSTMRDETKEKSEAQLLNANEKRIRENLLNTLTRKFVDVTKEYQKRQEMYKEDVRKKVSRQIKIVKEDATEEEIDAIMQSEGGTGEVFKTAILKAAAPAQQAYTDAVEKYKEVMELNKSVEEVAQLFLDFALITEQQGELLDQIEFQVEAAAEYVSKGNEDMEEAIEIQKSIRQKMMWIIFAVVVLVVIVVGVTMGVQ
uniref:t-SNARE coiled-coil homology domain-containing protein n=1 Tax=Octactis speculum TaxID=3111310 RepID=A0A7S2CNF4_9STRA|mmetsp:Transcript_38056/g.51483  ORF Transcript_38056/g.51483 Transcript_38056/m.51483 type:complete len:312 (+) Transcript_38056:78-1013(+)|eukprot:CAMPEP_0185763588 /NCGR_PEP_ID=MMETSP1174-20130828/22512_1 /TAXON_ID=35687 /ORGANISM="Dictyocha speculum, Strain CCMP1381" /LENGTH=311 /DNA_ID=CAMNT_0028445761 /DNA_START=73 /DNA_END=1008 /DNA_ORIENTATION=-